jgi:carboxypeptidase PM20D1
MGDPPEPRVVRKLAAAGLVLATIIAALGLASLRLPSRQLAIEPVAPRAVDAEAVARRLGEAIRVPTISFSSDPAQVQGEAFAALRAWLERAYPRLHRTLHREVVSEHSLLFTWPGSDPSLAPILLLAHQDVVPAENAERWSRPPFDGRIEDGFVWGRGAIDDKGPLIAICEAVELLLGEGFTPRRTVILAFGHDEEVGGQRGAQAIAELLESRGVRALLAIDEGSVVADTSTLPGLRRKIALVGIAEKGSTTLDVVARGEGGHSSAPPRTTAAGILARAISRIEANPMPGGVDGVFRSFFEWLAPELPLVLRTPLANLWLFAAPLRWALSAQPGFDALLRTTTAVTMLSGSPKENVLPTEAIATVNFRLIPGDTGEMVRSRIEAIVDDSRVEVRFRSAPREASAVSPTEGPAWTLVQRAIGDTLGAPIVAPFLVAGSTDCRHYHRVTSALYRFAPLEFGRAQMKLPHGIDERIAVANLPDAVRFYARVIEDASAD